MDREAIINKIEKMTEMSSGCWVWKGSQKGKGYGKIRIGDKHWLAHRASYECYTGPIPEGMQLDHLCRNRLCVNPEHLEPVTGSENSRRGMTGHHMKHSAPKGEDHKDCKLTWEKVRDIRKRYESGEGQYDLAVLFNVSQPSISRIVNGKGWLE